MIKDPLSAFSEVVDDRRRWSPDWYSWLKENSATIRGVESDIATLQGQVTILQGQVITLQGDVSTLQGNVSTLQSNVSSILDQLSSASTQNVTWTPALTFATPGAGLVITYSSQLGKLFRLGWLTFVQWRVTATVTPGASSGSLNLTGMPLTSFNSPITFRNANLHWSGVTFSGGRAGYTDVTPALPPNSSTIVFATSGSGKVNDTITAADIPAASAVDLAGTIIFAI